MRDEGRRARIVAAVTDRDATGGAGELLQRLCRFAMDEMTLSGCALALMPGTSSANLLASAGPQARTITELQMDLGEGPCLQAFTSRVPVLLPDLAAGETDPVWPED